MFNERHLEAIEVGNRAIDLARRIGDQETYAHALTNVGTAVLGRVDHERGRSMLEDAHARAVEAGEDDHAARALVNLATCTLMRRRDDLRVERDLERAIAFATERDLDGYVQFLLGARAHLRLRRGVAGAEADAHASMGMGEHRGVSLCPALIVLGRLQSRRGEPEATTPWRTHGAARSPPASCSGSRRRRSAWPSTHGSTAISTQRAAAIRRAWPVRTSATTTGRAASWPGGCGARASSAARRPTSPIRTRARSRGTGIARRRLDGDRLPVRGRRMLSDAEDPAARVRALAGFDGLGAARPASALRLRLRALGVRRIPAVHARRRAPVPPA